jgi:hypothetical protein
MDNRRLQPGDLAICVQADLPENIGVIVEIIAVGIQDECWGRRHGPLCRVRAAGARPMHFDFKIKGRWYRDIAREGIAPENRLRRITPPGQEGAEKRAVGLVAPRPMVDVWEEVGK